MFWLPLTQWTGSWKELYADAPPSDPAALKAASAFYTGIELRTLANGLKVALKPIPGAKVVSTKLAYLVGSADEELDATGLSHYLEHLMFKGTDKIIPGDIDRMTLRNGGQNNAYTTEDMTVYHFDFAADRWETALEIEADRMRNLRIDERHEFEQEKGAVIEELARDEDEPWDLEQKAMAPLLYGKSAPYGHPIIGEREHVRRASAETIKSHYDKWYHPNNAILVVCGDFDPSRAIKRIEELFGPIPAGKLPERKSTIPIERLSPVHHRFTSKFEMPRMLMGFNTVDAKHPDAVTLEILAAILGGGKTSRLHRRLVEKEQIASAVACGDSAGRYPGSFQIQVELLVGKDQRRAEAIVLEEIERLRTEVVPFPEIARVKQVLLSSFVFGHESVHDLADALATGLLIHDLDYLKNWLPRLMAESVEDLQRVAKRRLQPETRVVVWSTPKAMTTGLGTLPFQNRPVAAAARFRADRSSASRFGVLHGLAQASYLQGPAPKAGGPAFSLKEARRTVLENGLTVLTLENRRLPILTVEAYVRNVHMTEPADKAGIGRLIGSLLDEGTERWSGPQIAEAIENLGGTMNLVASGGEVSVLSSRRAQALEVFLECLVRPAFPETEFTRLQRQQLSEIEEAERQPSARAAQLFEKLAYGSHPFARPMLGTRETVERLRAEDCRAFHTRLFVPNNIIIAAVGDFDSADLLADIRRLTRDWKAGAPVRPPSPDVPMPADFTSHAISMPEAAQLQFLMGHPGIRRSDPDYYKLLVMDHVLGTGPGFTDRLSARLRDREGLAYSVQASICATATEQPGTFVCSIGTDAANFNKVKRAFLEELRRIRSELPATSEVEDAKSYLLGSLPFEFTTNSRIAGKLIGVERVGLRFEYLDEFQREVAAVTPADILEVARKHIHPERMVLVAAGPIDSAFKPIRPN